MKLLFINNPDQEVSMKLLFVATWIAASLCVFLTPAPTHAAEPPPPPATATSAVQERAAAILTLVNGTYQALHTVTSQAEWDAATDVTPEHDAAASAAGKARAAFDGNPALVTEAKEFLARERELDPLSVRQFRRVLLNAAEGPMTNPDLVAARIEAETKQASTLNSYVFKLGGQAITANEIDDRLAALTDVGERRAVWEASKESGPALKPGLVRLQGLRNGVARELDYPDYFSLQVASHDMTTAEMLQLHEEFLRELRPLYLQIYTWARYELAKKYNQPVPARIPAHWLPDRWAQDWSGLVEVPALDAAFKARSPEWIMKTAEAFYTGMGRPPLPASFWEKSDLYPVEAADTRKKNTHASCSHIDLANDIRGLLNVESNEDWFGTAHHELGHAYYDLAYARPDVPPLLRDSASPALHEAFAGLGQLAARQTPYLKSLGLLPGGGRSEDIMSLLRDALAEIPFMFWASGVMTHWEADLYARELPSDQWNARWWQYVEEYQGLVPPSPRGEEFCDAATKTHVSDAPAYYFSYAIASVMQYQLHEHIARTILKQNPRSCNYAGSREAGAFMENIQRQGATRDWRTLLREATGEDLSTRAMMEYFRPLLGWLEKQNRGRTIGWE